MSDRDVVKSRAVKAVMARGILDQRSASNAVMTLMLRLTDPTPAERDLRDDVPLVRYIHLRKDGCWGFCGRKAAAFGPSTLKDGERLGSFATLKGGFGGGKPEIILMGLRYWGNREAGSNHISIANKFGVPVIHLHAKSPKRYSPRPAKWGFYEP